MFTASFTSAQGTVHTNAPVRIVQANCNTSVSKNLFADTAVDNESLALLSEQENTEFSYQAEFWATQSAYDNGNPPFKVLNSDKNTYLRIDPTLLASVEYDGLGLEACAEKHCLEHVLNIT
tara:strand:- start:22668 stop:23030 length:363 start_codon:yes stop_codon:yes gene_type:complete